MNKYMLWEGPINFRDLFTTVKLKKDADYLFLFLTCEFN